MVRDTQQLLKETRQMTKHRRRPGQMTAGITGDVLPNGGAYPASCKCLICSRPRRQPPEQVQFTARSRFCFKLHVPVSLSQTYFPPEHRQMLNR